MTDNTLREAAKRAVFKALHPLHPYYTECEMEFTLEREVENDYCLRPSTVIDLIVNAALPTTQPTDNTGLIEPVAWLYTEPEDGSGTLRFDRAEKGRYPYSTETPLIPAAALAKKDAEIAYLENWKRDAADQIVTLTRANVEKDAEIAALTTALGEPTDWTATYSLEWIAAARPPVHPSPMTGRQSFQSFEQAMAFMDRQPGDAEFVSLTQSTVRTFDRTDDARAALGARPDPWRNKRGYCNRCGCLVCRCVVTETLLTEGEGK